MESPRCSLKSSTNPNLAIAHWRNVTTRMRRKRKTLHRMERTENRCMKRVRSRIFKPSERFWRNEFYSNIRFFKSVWMYLSNQISTNSRYNWNRYALKHWRRKNNAWNIFAIRFKLLGIESTASVCNFLSLLYYHSIWRAKGRDIQNLIAFFYFPALCYAELYYYNISKDNRKITSTY